MNISFMSIPIFGEYLEIPSIQSIFEWCCIVCLNVDRPLLAILAKYATQQTSLMISYSVGGLNGDGNG